MESAPWRSYRGHLIIARRTFLGRVRYDVWTRGERVGSWRSVIDAELHIDDGLRNAAREAARRA